MRALEEEMERKNILYGKGATPSMGLSQYRGGGFDTDQRQIRAFGQYSDDGEMEGGMSHLHNEFRDYHSASDHFAKADQVRKGGSKKEDDLLKRMMEALAGKPRITAEQMERRLREAKRDEAMDVANAMIEMSKGKKRKGGVSTGKYEGEGKYGRFKDENELMEYYFDRSEEVKRDADLRSLLNELEEILRAAREPDEKIMEVRNRISRHHTMMKKPSRPSAVFLSPGRDKGKESVDDIIRRQPPHIRKALEEEMKKIEEEMKKKKGEGKRRDSSSSSESEGKCGGGRGRSARAQIVKKVMAEKGLSLIEASKYVKAHGLY